MQRIGDMQLVIGGVIGSAAQHIETFRAEGCCEASIRYCIAGAIGRYLDGQRPSSGNITHEEYAAISRDVCDDMKETRTGRYAQ